MFTGMTTEDVVPSELKVFISYSRQDMAFADELVAGLDVLGSFDVTIDRHDIHEGEDWKRRLGTLIAAADTVVFILSQKSAASSVCQWEVEEAERLSKRILPVQAEPLDNVPAPAPLAALNYVRFDPDEDGRPRSFMAGLVALGRTLNTDIGWLREHTRLLNRAREWQAASRADNRLLSGDDIDHAKAWLADKPKDAPAPTELHHDFISASERAESARLAEEQERVNRLRTALDQAEAANKTAEEARIAQAAASRRVVHRTVVGLVVSIALMLATGVLGLKFQQEARRADEAKKQEEIRRKEAEAAKKELGEKVEELAVNEARLRETLGQAATASLRLAHTRYSETLRYKKVEDERDLLAELERLQKPSNTSLENIRRRIGIYAQKIIDDHGGLSESVLLETGRQIEERYPGITQLPPHGFGALLSALATKYEFLLQKEIRVLDAIRVLIHLDELQAIPDQIRAMKWFSSVRDKPGIGKRREAEAELFEYALAAKDYEAEKARGLWLPEAVERWRMSSRGEYEKGWPMGAVINFTAGRSARDNADAIATIRNGQKRYGYHFVISRLGKIYQTLPLYLWGSHAGKSQYPGLGNGLSKKLVGIEITNAGVLTKTNKGYEPWWNKNYKEGDRRRTIFTEDQVRYVEKKDNIQQAGYYLKYTPKQEKSLTRILLWLRKQRPDVFEWKFVLGHDEVSPRRKNDPGGALSMTMPEFRAHLEKLEKERASATK